MKKSIFVAFIVSLGGFLFGFDAGIISGVMSYAGPEFNLNDFQTGWVVSSPSFTAMFAMLISGRLSDIIGRKKLLILAAFLYVLSIILSAFTINYEMLYIARMIGGIAFGIALVIAPTYIAEISLAESRGKLVSIQQLNIVLGFFAAFLSNYYFNYLHTSGQTSFLTEENVWRWMLGIVLIPSIVYYILLFFVPESPRWLFTQKRDFEAQKVLVAMHGSEKAGIETKNILESLSEEKQSTEKVQLKDLFKPALKFVFTVGLVIGVLQQITGINAIYFYATSIFKQTGIGNNASFSSGVLLSFITVVFTIVAMFLIDKMGRRPLLLIGVAGIAISMALCAYGFKEAKYQLTKQEISKFDISIQNKLIPIADKVYENDIAFKNEMKTLLGDQTYAKNEGIILENATEMNAVLVLIGVMGFIGCFAFSLGPVMWVLLSELFPNRYRGLAIGVIGFVNSFASWVVQQVFPWELSNLGNALTFLIFGTIALIGFIILLKILPETKGKSLEQIETDFVK
ncbi:sugar porter family MFS transporter [Flavobacterium sp. LHD-80]|uniref:sugar porter family MFS transporter n=1 Tax=Flavobacterium sp. LHD-80 TaxID=3071411 RepID=UPI0027E1BD91|nr:sugar porter family MFS transporter [Flavobacterium sp. LHD-80]MDQ6473019.1 sugar porter family MFS transporter [Flavobacterium sp. LHD-80]